jgi:hypothetical protein
MDEAAQALTIVRLCASLYVSILRIPDGRITILRAFHPSMSSQLMGMVGRCRIFRSMNSLLAMAIHAADQLRRTPFSL